MNRFWEIDFLRGIAITMMVLFHIIFDLTFFGTYNFLASSNFWYFFGKLTAALFILIVGISLTLSYFRAKNRGKVSFQKYLKRGARIFSWGMLITFVTFILFPNYFIFFGILHLIGLSIILGYFFFRFLYLNLILGTSFIFLGFYLSNFTSNLPWLLWLGLTPTNLYTFDYYPLFPWFGFVPIGIFIGNYFYSNYKRNFNLPKISNYYTKLICFFGRNSLRIYLLHQPIILIILFSLGLIEPQLFLNFT